MSKFSDNLEIFFPSIYSFFFFFGLFFLASIKRPFIFQIKGGEVSPLDIRIKFLRISTTSSTLGYYTYKGVSISRYPTCTCPKVNVFALL